MVIEVDRTCSVESLSVGIVLSEFNEFVVENLLEGCVGTLTEEGLDSDCITVYRVPGAFEIPGAISQILDRRGHDGIIGLGAVIRGETPHFEYISSHVSRGIGQLSMDADIPVHFGVLTTDTRNQALQRARSGSINKGAETAEALLQSIGLYRSL